MTPERKAQWSWALTAWANHGYATTVLVAFFPIFLDRYWATGVDGATSTAFLALANGGASLVVMLLAPTLGMVADRHAAKKRLLVLFSAIGILATTALAFIGEGQWLAATVVFAISSIGFFSSYSFLDALITDVSDAGNADRVSAFGYAIGYLGGGIIFLIDVLLVLFPQAFGLPDKIVATKVAFISVAVWWAVFMLPLIWHVHEAPPPKEPGGWAELKATALRLMKDPSLRCFLIGYWLYIDALGTLQMMAVDYGAKLGFPTDSLIKALLLVQFVSFPAALFFGWLAGRTGTRRAIYVGLAALVFVSIWSYFMHTVEQFYVMAGIVGLVQGGVQSLSRSFFARLIPAGKSGEYFGFYNFLGKFAAVLGPFIVAAVVLLTDDQRLSIFPLAGSFIVGAWLLSRVKEPRPV
ncbi:MAG: MFS transporter [Nevskiaceae bacterium]|nr:MAG: MFS transporter [Nevskiaceae bacterium]TBR74676.1 MAG: MFS transporter [Nevskiaceae bacterium]